MSNKLLLSGDSFKKQGMKQYYSPQLRTSLTKLAVTPYQVSVKMVSCSFVGRGIVLRRPYSWCYLQGN